MIKRIAVLRANPKDAALARLLTALSKSHQVECYIWDRQGDYQPGVTNSNITYRPCRIKSGFYDLKTLLKLPLFEAWMFFSLLVSKVDCIQAIDLDTGLVGLIAARLRRKPFIYFCADPYYTLLPKSWPKFLAAAARWLENFVITHADLFVITDLLRMPMHEGAKPRAIVEFANVPFLELSQYRKPTGGKLVTGYIGSLSEGRSVAAIVEAAGELQGHGVTFIIGGFGPLEAAVAESAAKHDNITWVSYVPYEKLLELEGQFGVFIHVTDPTNESVRWVSPSKLFESMAFGKPIIVAAGTLSGSKVAKIGNGVTVEYGSAQQIKDAILTLMNSPDLAREMGEKGKQEFEKNWTTQVMESRLLDAITALGSP